MDWLVFISGLIALVLVIGHFTVGSKNVLKPMLDASFDDVPKKTMLGVFHNDSVFLALSAAALILVGFGVDFNLSTTLLVRFIALNFSLFAIWRIVIALQSGNPGALTKMFQWIFFVLIAIFAWLGA